MNDMSQAEQKRGRESVGLQKEPDEGLPFSSFRHFVNALKNNLRLPPDFFSVEEALKRFKAGVELGNPGAWVEVVDWKPGVDSKPRLLIDRGAGQTRFSINMGRETKLPVNGEDRVPKSSLLYSLALAEAKLMLVSECAPEAYAGLHLKIGKALHQVTRARKELLSPRKTAMKMERRSLTEVWKGFINQEPDPQRRAFVALTLAVVLAGCTSGTMTETPDSTQPVATEAWTPPTDEPTEISREGMYTEAPYPSQDETGFGECVTETDLNTRSLIEASNREGLEHMEQLIRGRLWRQRNDELGAQGQELMPVEETVSYFENNFRFLYNIVEGEKGSWIVVAQRLDTGQVMIARELIGGVPGGLYIQSLMPWDAVNMDDFSLEVMALFEGADGQGVMAVETGTSRNNHVVVDMKEGSELDWRHLSSGEIVFRISPELQRVQQEMEAAGMSGYTVEGNSIYWQATGVELVRFEGEEAVLSLVDGSQVRVEAEKVRVVTQERNQDYIGTQVSGRELFSNIAVVDDERSFHFEADHQYPNGKDIPWVEYVVVQDKIVQIPEPLPPGLQESLDQQPLWDLSSIPLEHLDDVVNGYYTWMQYGVERQYYDVNGWPDYPIGHPSSGSGPRIKRAFGHESWELLTSFESFSGDTVEVSSWVRIKTESGKILHLIGVPIERSLGERGGPTKVRIILHYLLDPESMYSWLQDENPSAADRLFNDMYSAEALFEGIKTAWQLTIRWYNPYLRDGGLVAKYGLEDIEEFLKRLGGAEGYTRLQSYFYHRTSESDDRYLQEISGLAVPGVYMRAKSDY